MMGGLENLVKVKKSKRRNPAKMTLIFLICDMMNIINISQQWQKKVKKRTE